MHKILTILIILSSQGRLHASPKDDAITAIQALFPALAQETNSPTKKKSKLNFDTSACNFQEEKWQSIVLTKQSFKEKIVFSKDCDLNGEFTVEMDKWFPIKLKLRNFKSYREVSANLKFQIVFEDMPLLKLELKGAKLTGKTPIQFKMKYGVYINPMDPEPFKKHKGGKLTITRIDKKAINKSFQLNFTNK